MYRRVSTGLSPAGVGMKTHGADNGRKSYFYTWGLAEC